MHWKMCFTKTRTSLNPWLEEWIWLQGTGVIGLSKRPNKYEDIGGFLIGPNVWLEHTVLRLRQTGVITAIESRLATVIWTSFTDFEYSKSLQDAPTHICEPNAESNTQLDSCMKKAPPIAPDSICLSCSQWGPWDAHLEPWKLHFGKGGVW